MTYVEQLESHRPIKFKGQLVGSANFQKEFSDSEISHRVNSRRHESAGDSPPLMRRIEGNVAHLCLVNHAMKHHESP